MEVPHPAINSSNWLLLLEFAESIAQIKHSLLVGLRRESEVFIPHNSAYVHGVPRIDVVSVGVEGAVHNEYSDGSVLAP